MAKRKPTAEPKFIITGRTNPDGSMTAENCEAADPGKATLAWLKKRGCIDFQHAADVKETTNWNLNGDQELYRIQFLPGKNWTAFIYD